MSTTPPLERGLVDKINAKIKQLQTQGLNLDDHEVLRDRFAFIWREPEDSSVSSTKSRQSRARRTYKSIQDASNHLFLGVLIVVSPTVCINREVQAILSRLVNLETFDNFRFQLGLAARRFFESTAAEQGFVGNPLYLSFMQSMFPEQEARHIQFAYSLVDREKIKGFLDEMLQGIISSKQWIEEENQGGSTSGCVTIFIPSGQHQDGSCTIRVNRTMLTQTIHKYNMTQLRLE